MMHEMTPDAVKRFAAIFITALLIVLVYFILQLFFSKEKLPEYKSFTPLEKNSQKASPAPQPEETNKKGFQLLPKKAL